MRSDPDVWSQRFVEESRNRLGESLTGIILVGSAARGDFVDGFSDLDFLIILRPDDEAVGSEALQRISALRDLCEREGGIGYGINILSERSLFSQSRYPLVNPFALHEFASSGRTLYGTGIEGIRLPNYGSPAMKRCALGEIEEAKKVLASTSSLSPLDRPSLERALRIAIWCTFRAAKAYLVTEGELVTGKDAILRMFREKETDTRPELGSALRRVYEARDHWEEVRASRALLIDRFRASLDFVNGLADDVQRHPRPQALSCSAYNRG